MMDELQCEGFFKYYPSLLQLKELRLTFIANCSINNFLTYTAVMLNITTIYAIQKTTLLPKTLRTLLLSLAVSDIGVGLFVQPFHSYFLVIWMQLQSPSCITYQINNVVVTLFAVASFLGVVALSVDRFFAIHFHLRYNEIVTHKRVVAAVSSVWIFSVFVSSMKVWCPVDTGKIVLLVIVATGLAVTAVVYTRVKVTVQRHKNQIQSLQVQEVAQASDTNNYFGQIKSTVCVFYVYIVLLVCSFPYAICIVAIQINGPTISLKGFHIFSLTLALLNSSLNPVIYCWKMRHIRHAIVNILRNMSWARNFPLRLHNNRSSNVVHVENWTAKQIEGGRTRMLLRQTDTKVLEQFCNCNF